MRKRELVYLHSLLAVCREWLDEREEVPEAAFETYDAAGVRPTAVDRKKAAHREAVGALLDGLVTTVDAVETAETERDAADGVPFTSWN